LYYNQTLKSWKLKIKTAIAVTPIAIARTAPAALIVRAPDALAVVAAANNKKPRSVSGVFFCL
jgi:hypothetical protein